MTNDNPPPEIVKEYPPYMALIVEVLEGLRVVFQVTALESQPIQKAEE